MAYVEAGEFIMGSNERWDDESPEHINETGAFYIDINEVTNADYKNLLMPPNVKHRTIGRRESWHQARKIIL